jgi:hypothetical protein
MASTLQRQLVQKLRVTPQNFGDFHNESETKFCFVGCVDLIDSEYFARLPMYVPHVTLRRVIRLSITQRLRLWFWLRQSDRANWAQLNDQVKLTFSQFIDLVEYYTDED